MLRTLKIYWLRFLVGHYQLNLKNYRSEYKCGHRECLRIRKYKQNYAKYLTALGKLGQLEPEGGHYERMY